jgi:hypothetical protein
MHVQPGTWLCTLAPAALWLGPIASIIALVVLALLVLCTSVVFTSNEKQQFVEFVRTNLERVKPRLKRPGVHAEPRVS